MGNNGLFLAMLCRAPNKIIKRAMPLEKNEQFNSEIEIVTGGYVHRLNNPPPLFRRQSESPRRTNLITSRVGLNLTSNQSIKHYNLHCHGSTLPTNAHSIKKINYFLFFLHRFTYVILILSIGLIFVGCALHENI